MSLFSWLGGLFDPSDQQAANAANQGINDTLAANSPYWQAAHLTGDQGVIQGAAQLQNTHLGVDTSAVDADSAQLSQLGGLYGDIAKNGGRVTEAAVHQAQADAARTGTKNLLANERQSADTVQSTDIAERNFGAQGQTQSRAQVLANALKKQAWNTAVSHANFEAALAGQGLMNQDSNTAQQLALGMSEGAASARNSQQNTSRAFDQSQFNNGMAVAQMLGGAVAQGAGAIAGMGSAAQAVNAANTIGSGYTQGATNILDGSAGTGGYQTSTALGSSPVLGALQSKVAAPAAPTMPASPAASSTYVNPISGSTTNSNVPSDVSAWAPWLANNSTLVA